MSGLIRWAVVAASLVGTIATGTAQSGNQPSPQSGYTLHANAREVITDVTVTDRKGNPIHGLSESAFHIFDNGKPQHLATFEEHTGTELVSLSHESAGIYSNDILLHPPRAWNVILIDASFMGFVDQAYLNLQLEQFIKQLPPDEPFAVLARRGRLVMFANFTADHQRLLDAVRAVVPHFQRSMDGYGAPRDVVDELCGYLQQFPGRKNVFWFQGAGGLSLPSDPTTFINYQDMSGLYDQLESARVALYPVDVRGLQAPADPLVASDPSMFDHLGMEEEAEATGGQAVVNRNNIADEVKHLADNDASFYTLTYSPQEIKLDNKWHKINVRVDEGDYRISYRRGYFDDGSNLAHSKEPARKRLLQDGAVVAEVRMTPIALQVRATPMEQVADLSPAVVIHSSTAPTKKGERSYDLHYSVPLEAFPKQAVGTQNQLSLGLGVFAFDQHGRSISRIADKVTLSVSQEHIDSAPPDARIGFDQQINLPNGEDFLYVAVWDPETGRAGTLQIPLAVAKATKP
jgi:VWFA-related protein